MHKCRLCGGAYGLTKKGYVKTHYLFTVHGRSPLPCAGSGGQPAIGSSPKGERVLLPAPIVISGKAQLFASLNDLDVESVRALHSRYESAKQEGLKYITSSQLMAQNALVLATKGHAFRDKEGRAKQPA